MLLLIFFVFFLLRSFFNKLDDRLNIPMYNTIELLF